MASGTQGSSTWIRATLRRRPKAWKSALRCESSLTRRACRQHGVSRSTAMGLAWQQGPLATRSVGRFLVADPLPERLLFAEPLRRRMRVRFGGQWVVESEDVVLLHEPDRYPVAYFPLGDVRAAVLASAGQTTRRRERGPTAWFSVSAGC